MMVAAYFRAACATRLFPSTLAATCCSRAPGPTEGGVPAPAGPTVNADAADILLLLLLGPRPRGWLDRLRPAGRPNAAARGLPGGVLLPPAPVPPFHLPPARPPGPAPAIPAET